jgi:hypothetical protein
MSIISSESGCIAGDRWDEADVKRPVLLGSLIATMFLRFRQTPANARTMVYHRSVHSIHRIEQLHPQFYRQLWDLPRNWGQQTILTLIFLVIFVGT